MPALPAPSRPHRAPPRAAAAAAAAAAEAPSPSSAAASLVTAAQTCLAVFAAFALHSADEQLNLLQRSQEVVFSRARTAQPAPQAAERVRAQLYEHARQLRALTPALQAWAEAALEDETVNAPDVRRRVLLPLVEIGTIATRSAAQVEVDAEGAVAAAPAALTDHRCRRADERARAQGARPVGEEREKFDMYSEERRDKRGVNGTRDGRDQLLY